MQINHESFVFDFNKVFWTGAKYTVQCQGSPKRHLTSCKTKSVCIRLLTWLQSSSQVNAHDFKQIVYYQALFIISLFKNFNEENAKKKIYIFCHQKWHIFSLNSSAFLVKEGTDMVITTSFVCFAERLPWRWVSESLFLLLFRKKGKQWFRLT